MNDIFDEARETYAKNAGKYIYMDKSDIRKIKEFPKADIVLGGFPCPGFSEAGPRLVDDKRNFLYLHVIRCLMQSQPKTGRQAPIHPAGEPMVNVGKDKYIFSDGEEKNRRLSAKEISRIQTFPDWYEFSRGTSNRNDNAKLDLVYKQIGNAVPVRLALAIAEFVKVQLKTGKKEMCCYSECGKEKRMMA